MRAPLLVRHRIRGILGEAAMHALWLWRWVCYATGMRRLYHALLIYLVKRTKLFDGSFYLEFNSDVVRQQITPLRHYVTHGDREGREPMAFFDPAYYRAHAKAKSAKINALLHYSLVGRHRRTSPSPWFDMAWYLAHNKDVARSGHDPLLHFLRWGGREGRSPGPQFDSAYYLRRYPDVETAGINPLLHYLSHGRFLRYKPRSEAQSGDETPVNTQQFDWNDPRLRRESAEARIDVIIPVYQGRAETLRCIHSVLTAHCTTPYDLVVIDDASPDPELAEELNRLVGMGLFTLFRNEKNLGFVQTVNRGMRIHPDRDVVLLNSDTEVYGDWLDRLCRAAARNERTGTVTPLSNNATICSYPLFLHDNPFPLEVGYAELDAITSRVNAEAEIAVPTGVGFCMYIKRDCLREVGMFDAETFGKGYGEENDFCQRAVAKGWQNIIAGDVFVRHSGAASFKGEKAKRVEVAMKILAKRYPRYHREVADFIERDPLKDIRKRLDWERLRCFKREKNVLIVSHNRGGGTERHVQEDVDRLSDLGYGVFLMRPATFSHGAVRLEHRTLRNLPNLGAFDLRELGSITAALTELGVTEIHTHGLVDYPDDAPVAIENLVRALGARWEVNLHDYKVICPRINLADEHGFYCGEIGEAACNDCLNTRGSAFRVKEISMWRKMHRAALTAADAVLVPDPDMATRLSTYYPGIHFEVSPHELLETPPVRMPALEEGERLRIMVIGAIGKLKGYEIVLACARDAKQRKLPLDFVLLGYSMNDRLLESAGVYVTGKYNESEAQDYALSLGAHVVWLPSLWPETYSYTLSLALRLGLPTFAFDLGAIGRRLTVAGMGHLLMPLDLAKERTVINDRFTRFRTENLRNVNRRAS